MLSRNSKTAGGAFRLIDDASELAGRIARLRALNEEYDRAIAALVVARREERGIDERKAPDMPLTIQREILVLTGAQAELERFDAEQGPALRAEQEARSRALRAAAEAPARRAALERHVRSIASRMEAEVDLSAIETECERLFAPAAHRMLKAARAFVEAFREMRAIANALGDVTHVSEVSVFGDGYRLHRFKPIGATREGDMLPNEIATLSTAELQELNLAIQRSVPLELVSALREKLAEAGLDGRRLTLYRAGSPTDERAVCAVDPNPPSRRPEPMAQRFGGHEHPAPATVISA